MPGYISRGDREPLGGLFAYSGTQGHVDRPASIERAEREARDGTAADRSLQILALLRANPLGLTWGEVADRLDLHHGQASGALSNLHKTGRVFMLREKRGRSHPYVHEDFRTAYTETERFDTPAQTRGGKIRELERQIVAALEADHVRGYRTGDRWIDSLIAEVVELREGDK